MKNRFHYFLLVSILCVSTHNVYAQHDIFIGAKGGICIPNLKAGTDNPLSRGYATSLGADFGMLGEYSINKWLAIQAEINYSQEGGKNDGFQPLINPRPDLAPQPYLYANYKSVVQIDYLTIPIMAKFSFKLPGKINFYVNAGCFVAFALGGHTATNGSSKVYMDPEGQQEQWLFPAGTIFTINDTTDIKDSIKTFNAGAILSVGFSYPLGPGKIFVEGGANYGFISVQKNPDNGTNYAGAITAHIGYACLLHRKRKPLLFSN
jgi:hypothetical protein